eukprot:1161620-Pelagomonas_calceolata.AAC.5
MDTSSSWAKTVELSLLSTHYACYSLTSALLASIMLDIHSHNRACIKAIPVDMSMLNTLSRQNPHQHPGSTRLEEPRPMLVRPSWEVMERNLLFTAGSMCSVLLRLLVEGA